MRILLLGSNGQLGTDLQAAAAKRDERIALRLFHRDDLDVTRLEAIAPALGRHDFDVLINCTSYHKTDEVEGNATQAFAVNAHAVAELAKVCSQKHALFVHISSDYVFDGSVRRPYVETDSPRPINVYGASKAMGECLALAVCERILILRVASLFGVAGASGKGGNFVETMIRVGREKGQLRVVDDVTMSPTATSDAAEIIVQLLLASAPAGIYHVVNSGSATWCEFARAIVEGARVRATVTPITSAEFPTRALRPVYSVLNNAKTAGFIGVVPDWTDALHRYLRSKGHI